MLTIIFIVVFAILNRARGSKFFTMTDSTEVGRLFSMFIMSAAIAISVLVTTGSDVRQATAMLLSFSTLMLWCTFAWDNYWAAAIGSTFDPAKPTFAPADFILTRLPFFKGVYKKIAFDLTNRLWGAVALGIRHILAIIPLAAVAMIMHRTDMLIYSPLVMLFGFIYMTAGYIVPRSKAVEVSEYLVGGSLGALFSYMIR